MLVDHLDAGLDDIGRGDRVDRARDDLEVAQKVLEDGEALGLEGLRVQSPEAMV
jgi:hypothetical protein